MISKLCKYGAKNILRNAFLSASSVLILTLLMFFINILVVLHDVSFRIIDSVNERLTISLYLDSEYDKNSLEVIDLQNDIRSALPMIDMQYKTKEELLEDLRQRDPELVNILERQNPLPETITLENIPLKRYEELNSIVENKLFLLSDTSVEWSEIESGSEFSSYTRQFERITDLIGVLSMLQVGLYIIIVTFLVSIGVIIYSIIGNFIYYYKDEIYITRLVWGSKLFIYGPFTIQWMIYVAISFVLSSIISLMLLGNISYLFGLASIWEVYTGNIVLLLTLELLVFLAIGGLSWFFSSRRYLKK